jgi:hypothetical protein
MGPDSCRLRLGHGAALAQHSKHSELLSVSSPPAHEACPVNGAAGALDTGLVRHLVYHEMVDPACVPGLPFKSPLSPIAAAGSGIGAASAVGTGAGAGMAGASAVGAASAIGAGRVGAGMAGQIFVPVEVCQSSNLYLLPPKAVTTTDSPLARFVHHGVPFVLGTDNDGVMRMVGGGDHSGKSVLSEMWRAILCGHFAPHAPRAAVVRRGNTSIICKRANSDERCTGVLEREHLSDSDAMMCTVQNCLQWMRRGRFGQQIRRPRPGTPNDEDME